jgi:assimilatory nitrate reductase catalytic subunit
VASGVPVKTTCPYCGVGCGVLATLQTDGRVDIAGDPDHPANLGRLCSKGAALGETLSLDDRLLHPMIHGQRASWDAALDLVARRFSEAIAAHGPDSVAFYVSGQILTEDYYVANKLMKGFIGSANIDTNSRLCMASSVAGHKRAFGADTVPGVYADLELADLVVLVGSNLAWCHPVLYQRLAEARRTRGTRVVVIDPRRTATVEIADLHLAIAPGSDVALFAGLLAHLAAAGPVDGTYVAEHTTGFVESLAATDARPLSEIARLTGLTEGAIADFFELFAATEKVVTVYSQGVNQSSAGTDKVNAILNCHLATGRIGRPGMGPFSVTGQPNAMGGRETGGLATMLAAHMDLADAEHRRIVQEFWRSPKIPTTSGLKAVDLFRAVGEGRIRALWIMATNPVDSLPEADAVRAALASCPFVVVSDVALRTDTTAHAHVLLPAAAWGEKDGTVTNSERRISRQRSFLPIPGETRPDWWQLAEVGKRMGFPQAFSYDGPSDIFDEYARLTAAENDGRRDLDLSGLTGLGRAAYDALEPAQWPRRAGEAVEETRFFAAGGFYTPDRRARFVPTPFRAPLNGPTPEFPLVLNTGRLRDQWHTMTRTAKSARLSAHAPEPFVELCPEDAAASGVIDGALAVVASVYGSCILRVRVTDWQRAGCVFVPMHWTDQLASRARVGAIVNPETDPVSGQPELKHTPVRIAPYVAEWQGVLWSVAAARTAVAPFVAVTRIATGFRTELAGDGLPRSADDLASSLGIPMSDVLAYRDSATGQQRLAAFDGGRLIAALFVGSRPPILARDWIGERLGTALAPTERLRLLAGRPGEPIKDRGPLVCACLEVGRNDILAAIHAGCRDVAAVGDRTKAGTNCGSCRSDIGRLIDEARLAEAG